MKRGLKEVVEVAPTPVTQDSEFVIETLSHLVTDQRLSRMQQVLARRTGSVVVVLEDIADPHNGAAIFRSCDAFGCHEVHIVKGRWPFAISDRVSRGTERWLDITLHDSAESCQKALKARGFALFVATMEGTVTPTGFGQVDKVALVFGNEHKGVSDAMRLVADGTFQVPMSGFVESLNVSVAAAVTLFTVTANRLGDLSKVAQRKSLARYLLSEVRDAKGLLENARAKQAIPI